MEPTSERPERIPEPVWAHLTTEVKVLVVELCEENRKLLVELREENRKLLVEVSELRAKVTQNSSNSSLPPSSDRPWDKPKRKKRVRGGKRGGQKGHPPHVRQLVPPELVNVKDYHPTSCRHCGYEFDGGEESSQPPIVEQKVELPQVAPEVTNHQFHYKTCPQCRRATRAERPAGVPSGTFGPRVLALIAVLTVAYHLSKRQVKGLLNTVLGIDIGLGTLAGVQKVATAALAQPVKEVQEALKRCHVVGQDETRWPIAGKNGYAWVAVSGPYGLYHIAQSRSGEVARSLLGGPDFKGYSLTDRYAAYTCYPMERRGLCHEHLKRDYKKIADRSEKVRPLGEALVQLEKDIFASWHEFKDEKITRRGLQLSLTEMVVPYEKLLVEGMNGDDPKVAGMCENILKHRQAIWRFGWVEGMEPTNNETEQAARLLVVLRKKCYGTQSSAGATFVGHMATVFETCRRQARNVLGFVTDAMTAFIAGTPPPSLLVDDST